MIKVSTIAIAGGTLVMAAAIGVFMQTGQQDTSSFAPATPVETETLSNLPKDAQTPGSIQETPVQLAAITLTSSDVTRLPDTMTWLIRGVGMLFTHGRVASSTYCVQFAWVSCTLSFPWSCSV